MKKIQYVIGAGLMLASTVFSLRAQQQDIGLPVINHDGKDCYFYTVKGNESVFGLLSRFGWDEETFMRYNPKAANLKKGMVLYYPMMIEQATQQGAEAKPATSMVSETTVPSRPQEDAAASESSIPQVAAEPFIYTVKDGDTLYALARTYNTTVADIFRANRGLRESDLDEGTRLRIIPGAPGSDMRQVPVVEKKMVGKRTYKTQAADTWESLAADAGITPEMLRAVNDSDEPLFKGKKIIIPLVADTTVMQSQRVIDPRENTTEGRLMIYKEVHRLGAPLEVTLLTGTTTEDKKRDLEFVRGFLLGLDTFKSEGGRVKLHVRQADTASLSAEALASDSVLDASSLIIALNEKDFPASLAAYASEHEKQVINVFDAKSDLYLSSAGMMQLLPPSADFYGSCVDFLMAGKPDSKYIFIAEDEPGDEAVSLILLERLIREGRSYETLPSYEALREYAFSPSETYVVVSDLNRRSDISRLATDISAAMESTPGVQISLVGRPTWVVFADQLKEKFQKADTYVPSRFFQDGDGRAVKDFDAAYQAAYDAAPLKSFPAYAAMGYDVARYFLPHLLKTGGDMNGAESCIDALQLDFHPERPEMWSGMLNGCVYLIHFTPYNTVDKIRL